MQNKQAIVGIVAAVLILVGAGVIFTLDKAKTASQPASIARSVSPTSTNTMQSTVAGIFKSTKNQKCDFSTKTEKSEVKGTVYVSSNSAFGQFTDTTGDKSQTTNLIRNGDTYYIWGDSLAQGVKMTMSVEDLGEKLSSGQYVGVNPNDKTNIKCESWTPDSAKFVAPTSIKFYELTSNAPSSAKTTPGQPSDQCSLCNSMTGNAKTTCLSSFKCK